MAEEVRTVSIEEWLNDKALPDSLLAEFRSKFSSEEFDAEAANAWLKQFVQCNSIEDDDIDNSVENIYVPPFTEEELFVAIDQYDAETASKLLDSFDKHPAMVMYLMGQKDKEGEALFNMDDVCDMLKHCGVTIENDPAALVDVFNEETINYIATAEIGKRGVFVTEHYNVASRSSVDVKEENLLPYGILNETISRLNSWCDQYKDITPEIRKKIIDTFVCDPNYNESDLYNIINEDVKESSWRGWLRMSKKKDMLEGLEDISDDFKAVYNKNKDVYNEAFAKIDMEDEDKSLEDKVNELYTLDLQQRVKDVYEDNYLHPYDPNSFSFERQNDENNDEGMIVFGDNEVENTDEHVNGGEQVGNDGNDEHDGNDENNEHDGNDENNEAPSVDVERNHAEQCLNAHQEFLAKRQMLIEKYPEVLNLGEVLDDIYRQALTEGKAPKITNNIKTYVGVELSEDFIRDFKQMKMFVNRKGAEFVGDVVMRKVAKLDEPKTTEMLENIDLEAINNLSPLVRDDSERKAIDGFVNINRYKEGVLVQHPDMSDKLDSIISEVFVDGKQVSECSAMADLSDDVKADMSGFINIVENNAALNNPHMVKLVNLSKEDIETLLDIKREHCGDLVIDRFIQNRINKQEEDRTATEENTPPEENTSSEENTPTEENTSSEENTATEENTPTEENTAAVENTPTEENTSPEENTATEENTSPEENTATVENTPTEENTSPEENTAAEENTSPEENIATVENTDSNAAETMIDEAINSGEFTEEELDEMLDVTVSLEGNHVDPSIENGKRYSFSKDKFEKIEALNLSDEWKEKLDIQHHEDSTFSIKIPESNEDKKEFVQILSKAMSNNGAENDENAKNADRESKKDEPKISPIVVGYMINNRSK